MSELKTPSLRNAEGNMRIRILVKMRLNSECNTSNKVKT